MLMSPCNGSCLLTKASSIHPFWPGPVLFPIPLPVSAHDCLGSPEQGSPELGFLTSFQGPVTFGDIPFYFSREEWGSLDPAQRDLFWDIKRENSQNVALGKQWAQRGAEGSLALLSWRLSPPWSPSSSGWAQAGPTPAHPSEILSLPPKSLLSWLQRGLSLHLFKSPRRFLLCWCSLFSACDGMGNMPGLC